MPYIKKSFIHICILLILLIFIYFFISFHKLTFTNKKKIHVTQIGTFTNNYNSMENLNTKPLKRHQNAFNNTWKSWLSQFALILSSHPNDLFPLQSFVLALVSCVISPSMYFKLIGTYALAKHFTVTFNYQIVVLRLKINK